MADILKTIFCANDQIEQTHVLSASSQGEVQATCTVCGRVLKFPAGVTPDDFNTLLTEHKQANEGQVTIDSIDKTLQALADDQPEES